MVLYCFTFFRFVSLYDYDKNANLGLVAPQVFPQGYRDDDAGNLTNVPSVTITKKEKTSSPGVLNSTNATFESEKATNVVAIGAKIAGSYPVNYVIHQGYKDSLLLIPEWEHEKSYKKDDRVRFAGKVYKVRIIPTIPSSSDTVSSVDSTSVDSTLQVKITTTPHHSPTVYPTEWEEINTSSIIPTINPSPLTKQKAQYWVNATPGWIYANTKSSEKTAVVDFNGFLKIMGRRRTGVHCITNDSANLAKFNQLKKDGKPFDGCWVLVLGIGLNDFAGNDVLNKPKSNNVIIYKNNSWRVLPHWGVTRIDDEVWSIREGHSYTYKSKKSQSNNNRYDSWESGAYGTTTVTGDTMAFSRLKSFNCLHPVSRYDNGKVKIENDSIVPDEDPDGNSAVSIEFDATSDRSMFAGINFSPGLWPMSANNIPYTGKYSIGDAINKPYFDFFNMDEDQDGLRRTFGEWIEQYLPINGFTFWEKLQVETLGMLTWGGDYTMGLWLVDENDTVITISYPHSHNGTVEAKNPQISTYKIHHGILQTFDFGKF